MCCSFIFYSYLLNYYKGSDYMEHLIQKLIEKNKTISTMESCTGGALVNAITNVSGASLVLNYSAVTYSNEYKIKMGVSKNLIDKYTVYSKEVANEMAKVISNFTNSDYGVGITGKMGMPDINNPYGDDNTVYISIYDKNENKFYEFKFVANDISRKENNDSIIYFIGERLKEILTF